MLGPMLAIPPASPLARIRSTRLPSLAPPSLALPSLALSFLLLMPGEVAHAAPVAEKVIQGPSENGGVLVDPKRLVFSGRERRGEITLMNTSRRETTFRLELVERRMDETGRLLPWDDTKPHPTLDGMLRYSPRQITVPPGEHQTVRVFVRKPADLAEGEYRSHLQLRALPQTDAGPSIGDFADPDDGTLEFRVNALPAISLPIIVRHGALDAHIELTAIDLEIESQGDDPDAPQAAAGTARLQLDREGGRSVYGDVTATWLPALGGEPIRVGRARGVAIYTTIDQRQIDLPLFFPAGLAAKSGTLEIAFTSRPDTDGGGSTLVAETELTVP